MNTSIFKSNFLLIALLIIFNACTKELKDCTVTETRNFNVSGFSRLEAGDHIELNIIKGSAYSIKATGCASDLQDLNVYLGTGNILHLQFFNYKKKRYRLQIEITMPQLAIVQLSGAAKAIVSGFEGQNSVIRTLLSGAAECILTGTGINTNVVISGASKLTVTGTTLNLYGTVSGASTLHSYGLQSEEVDLSVSGTSTSYVFPTMQLFAEASGESRIFYKGNPPVKHINVSGNARVIHE